jgi:organic radical activating enzyme
MGSNGGLSRETVIRGFRYFLARDPESDAVIAAQQRIADEAALAKCLIASPEYQSIERRNPKAMKLFRGQKKTVSREEILWCYRTLLGREPESEAAILTHANSNSLKDLIECFVRSPEFLARTNPPQAVPMRNDRHDKKTDLIDPKLNDALAMAEYRAGVLEVSSSPRMLTLETSSRCNLRCVMCPQAINAVNRPKYMEEDLVEALERFILQARSIQLHGIGEPLVSPAFWSILKCLPHNCESSINTNLTVLDERRLNDLIHSNLKIVNVSLDAARPETYQKIRGHSFDEVIGNIRRLVEARRARRQKFPLLHMNMTLMRSNVEEVLEFIDLAVELGADHIRLWHLNRWPDTEMQRYIIERDGWVFDYQKEGLWNFPALSNDWLRKAEGLARQRGITLGLGMNTPVYFDE